MTASWLYPTRTPLFTDSWAQELMNQDHSKPTALGTLFRYSNAMACSRRLVFDAMGIEPSDPIDAAGLHVTTLGTYVHEQVQEALVARYGVDRVELEVKSKVGHLSGSADAVVTMEDGTRYLWELKTVGEFKFDKAVGVNRKSFTAGSPKGPQRSAIAQAAINALANNCDVVVIGYIAMGPLSKGLSEAVQMTHLDRFIAEWHIPRDVWEPLAMAEVARVEFLNGMLESNQIPEGDGWDDKTGAWKDVSPLGIGRDGSPRWWGCQYCPHLTTCRAYAEGVDVL